MNDIDSESDARRDPHDRDAANTQPEEADLPEENEKDRRREILDAAFEEFAEHGFRGATIKRIAQRARLKSQALIYWYFPAKEALFEAVLGQQLPIVQMALDPTSLMERPPEEVLPPLARAYLATADRPGAQRLVRLLAPELIRRPEVADAVGGPLIARALDFIKTYLAHQVELRRLRPHDVRASARAFIGMILPQLGGKLFLPALRADGLTDEEHIATLIDIFLHGLQPDDSRSVSTRSRFERGTHEHLYPCTLRAYHWRYRHVYWRQRVARRRRGSAAGAAR